MCDWKAHNYVVFLLTTSKEPYNILSTTNHQVGMVFSPFHYKKVLKEIRPVIKKTL